MELQPDGSGTPMWNSLSFDKINPDGDYIMGNVVLCIFKANLIKNRFSERESDLYKKLFSSHFKNQVEKAKQQSLLNKTIIKP